MDGSLLGEWRLVGWFGWQAYHLWSVQLWCSLKYAMLSYVLCFIGFHFRFSKSITFSKEGERIESEGHSNSFWGGTAPRMPPLGAKPWRHRLWHQTHTHELCSSKQWHRSVGSVSSGDQRKKEPGQNSAHSYGHHTHAPCGTFTLQCAIMQTHKKRIHTPTHPHTQARSQTLNPLLFSG